MFSNDTDNNNRLFPNDFYSEESEKNSPKIIDGKSAININEIIGEETDINIELSMIDDSSINYLLEKYLPKVSVLSLLMLQIQIKV